MLRTTWKSLSVKIESAHVFAIGDIHGHATLLREALETIARTKSDGLMRILVFTGDTINRGPENLETARLVQASQELAQVDQVVILPGNHEIMLSLALQDPSEHMCYWQMSGGLSLLREIDGNLERSSSAFIADTLRDVLPEYLLRDLSRAQSHLYVDNLLFVHAGISPLTDINTFLSAPYDASTPSGHHWAWIRSAFLEWRRGWSNGQPLLVVHGHEAAMDDLASDLDEISELCDRSDSHSRINLDVGAGENIAQIALAEFRNNSFRLQVFQDPDFGIKDDSVGKMNELTSQEF